MKKQFRIVVIASSAILHNIQNTMMLAFGKENVSGSAKPEDLFALLKKLRPTTLIIEPELFYACGITPEDINAYRKEIKYRILTVYRREPESDLREQFSIIKPEKEYISPAEYLTMAMEIPKLCTNSYTYRRAPLEEATKKNLERIFRDCGFRSGLKGAQFTKEALLRLYFAPELHNNGGATKIYRELAGKYNTTPRIVERSILRYLESSWTPKTEELLRNELNVSDHYDFVPINFARFTQIFNTYYTIKYGNPTDLLATPKKSKK